MPYRTVGYLAYRVSVECSAAGGFAADSAQIAESAARLRLAGGPTYWELLLPEISAQAARAAAAAERAGAAYRRCESVATTGRGPVIRVADGVRRSWAEDDATREHVGACFREASAAAAEAHLAFELVRHLGSLAEAVARG